MERPYQLPPEYAYRRQTAATSNLLNACDCKFARTGPPPQVLACRPGRAADAWYNRGNALSCQGRYDEAIKAYDKTLEINQQDIDAWYSKGLILKLLGRTIEADAAFARAEELGFAG